jgi:hypothetical protein
VFRTGDVIENETGYGALLFSVVDGNFTNSKERVGVGEGRKEGRKWKEGREGKKEEGKKERRKRVTRILYALT